MTCKAHPKVSAAGAGDGMNMPSRSGRQRSLPLRHWGLAKRVPGTGGKLADALRQVNGTGRLWAFYGAWRAQGFPSWCGLHMPGQCG